MTNLYWPLANWAETIAGVAKRTKHSMRSEGHSLVSMRGKLLYQDMGRELIPWGRDDARGGVYTTSAEPLPTKIESEN
jgi:hypothetical protein